MQISIVPTLWWCHYTRGRKKQILNRKISLFFPYFCLVEFLYFAKIHPVGEHMHFNFSLHHNKLCFRQR